MQAQLRFHFCQQVITCLEFSVQDIEYLGNDGFPDDYCMLSQQSFVKFGAKTPCRQCADQHIGIEKYPHETALKTSSSVR